MTGPSDGRRNGRGAAIGGRGIAPSAESGAWRLGWRDGDRGSAISGEGMVLKVVSAWSFGPIKLGTAKSAVHVPVAGVMEPKRR